MVLKLLKVEKKTLRSFEMWCWRRMQKIDILRNEELLHTGKEESNILHTVKRRKPIWIGHILGRNCLLKHAVERKIEGRIEVMGRRRRRRKKLVDYLKEKRESSKLNEEALGRTLWRTGFRKGYGPVARQTTQ
jgi:hypothetical protein